MESKSREQFEDELVKWWPQAEGNMVRDGDDYANHFMNYAWWGWQASRAALVVELPDGCEFGVGSSWIYSGNVSETLRAAGITVKGEGDEKANL